MKQRIIATILLLVTVLTMLASCVNYAFAEEAMDYVELDLGKLMEALHSIEIEEEDFGPDEDREALVVEEIYNTILTALNKDTDNEMTDGTIGANDMVKYYYYCSVKLNDVEYTFNHNMKTAVNTLTTSTSADEQKDIQKAIVAKIAADYTFDGETSYKIKTSLSNEKIVAGDRIVVSYTLKETDGTKTTYTDYAYEEIGAGHDIYDDIIANENAVLLGSYKANEGVVVDGKHYINITISHIIERDGTSVDVEHVTEDEKTATVYDANRKTSVVIPEGTTVTYHVYPVSYVKAPTVDAYDVIKYVLGDDITTESLDVFNENETVKALVESLVAEYAKTADDYAGEGSAVATAKAELATERELAKAQSIRDKIDALAKAKNGEGKTVTDAILAHVNGDKTAEDEGYKTIYDIFATTVKYADLLPLGVLGLYTYKNDAGTTAVTLVNAINAEHAKNVETDYDSYTKTKATISERDGKEIDVADKKERYDDEVAKAQTKAVEAIIADIIAVEGAEALIVEQYNASINKTEFLSYDLIKHILLSTSATESTFSFIEDLSDYVYGTSTLDDEERETFGTILAELTAEFAKSEDTDYDSVISVKDILDELEAAELEAASGEIGGTSIATYVSNLKNYKKDDVSAFTALAEKYIELHPNTVFVLENAKDNQKLASSYSSTVLTLILEDEDNREAYKAVVTDEYLNGEAKATIQLNGAIDVYDANKKVEELEEKLADARAAAKEAAVNELIAKLLSGVLEETEEHEHEHEDEEVSHKLSVVLANRYVDYTINTKISTYNTNVQDKLAKAIYEIINNQVVINTNHASYQEQYPWELVEEFEKTIKESYKSEFYTGTSDKTTAGTYGDAVSAEELADYEKYTKQYEEANEAITSANTGISTTTSAYVAALVVIYEMEALVAERLAEGEEAPASYFNAENPLTALVEAYRTASAAYDAAKAANTSAKSELTKAETVLKEAEELFESVKDEGYTIFNKEWWNARSEVKAAEKAVEAATEKVDGTKKTTGTADALTYATNDLNDAKEDLIEGFSEADVEGVDFVAAKKDFDSKKSTYSTESTDYKNALSTYNTKKTTLAEKQAAVDAAGEAVTEEQTAALTAAQEAFDTANEAYGKAIDAYLTAATAYADSALVYYAESKVVEEKATPDYDEAVAILEDTVDDEGNVTKEGLKTKIAKAEEYEAGEALTNVEVYGYLDAYLEYVLGYNWEAVIREQAVEAVNEQIKFYAVAKALSEVAANGYVNEELGINVQGYKAAIEAIEAEDSRITKLLEHSIKHNDEDIKEKKLQKEVEEAYEELLEATENVFVTDKVYKEYKKDLGRSNYTYAKDQYGENNLRMYLQVENLFTYLLYTDVQENEYAIHHGEYRVAEKDGKLAYLFISYEFKAEDAE